jgi:hypothetical protein
VQKADLTQLVGLTATVVGRKLAKVLYWCLFHEASTETAVAERFFHGGFTELRFENATLLVSWAEGEGWTDHFSLSIEACPASMSSFEAHHESFDVAESLLWRPHLGSVLEWARILGSNDTPHVLELGFAGGGVVLADGHEEPFGDGDDLVHWPAKAFWSDSGSNDIQCLWRSVGAAEAKT